MANEGIILSKPGSGKSGKITVTESDSGENTLPVGTTLEYPEADSGSEQVYDKIRFNFSDGHVSNIEVMTAATVIEDDMDELLDIPPDSTYVINGATIDADIRVKQNATLLMINLSSAHNITGRAGSTVVIDSTAIFAGKFLSKNGAAFVVKGATCNNVRGVGCGELIIQDCASFGNFVSKEGRSFTVSQSSCKGNCRSVDTTTVSVTKSSIGCNLKLVGATSCHESDNNVSGENFGCS